MSKVEDLKTAASQVANSTRTTANSLTGYKAKLVEQIGQIEGLIGGTATQADREVIASLSGAVQSTQDAITSLLDAARRADEYANQI